MSYTEKKWWITRESNPVCRETPDLQSGAVASAARNPNLVPRERFELPTHGFEGRRSIQLSQRGRNKFKTGSRRWD
jgi:hypothetical protein